MRCKQRDGCRIGLKAVRHDDGFIWNDMPPATLRLPPCPSIKPQLYQYPTRNQEFYVMAKERTFSIIKPDATRRNLTGKINAKFEEAGLRIVAQKRIKMSREQAEGFYAVHKARPFFNDLCSFMVSGPVVIQVLEGENAVLKNREIMGATNPANADAGTIRKEFAESIEANSVHGSDSLENANIEIAYFFKPEEIVG
jgi:nucleoside-diphosphate kinase